MAEGTRAYRRIGTRDPAAQRLARTLAQTEQVLTDGRRDRLLFHNLWGGRWARVFGGGGSEQRSTPARALCDYHAAREIWTARFERRAVKIDFSALPGTRGAPS